ncbi:TetR/AcrR family transcriptional regulator [Cognatishimia activa]|uniref:acrylate utilization transcriptional regulator AcuR n=1 Tax=Cognatishimia activa TaxID=1715691 RepID=UPI00222EBF0A|nr:TetR/AcrR family transcriptional regulator [Cognatishimia activa]UZD91524.1 TetR/AcrR family transcriptional regulator [Cognatishimia activa]
MPKKRGRPKRDPSTSETRQKLLRTGLAYLTERGYSSVGIDEILASSGVPKGSFYHYFRNKAEFGSALIESYDAYFVDKLERSLDRKDLKPLQQLRAFTEDAQAGMARHGFRRGCLIGNLGQEMASLPEAYREKIIQVLEGWQDRVAECLERAQSEGSLSTHHDSEALAAYFWIGWEGAVLRAKLEHLPDPLKIFVDGFFASLKA